MKIKSQPDDRLQRMRRMFSAKGEILLEDYEYFTQQGVSTPLSKVPRKLAMTHGRQVLKRS